jgi:hypothetical protein
VVAAGYRCRVASVLCARATRGICAICDGIPSRCSAGWQPLYAASGLGGYRGSGCGQPASGNGRGAAWRLQRRRPGAAAIPAARFGAARQLRIEFLVSARAHAGPVAPASFRSDRGPATREQRKRPAAQRERLAFFLPQQSFIWCLNRQADVIPRSSSKIVSVDACVQWVKGSVSGAGRISGPSAFPDSPESPRRSCADFPLSLVRLSRVDLECSSTALTAATKHE